MHIDLSLTEWVTLAVIIGLVLLMAHVYNGRYLQDWQGGTVWALLWLGLAGALFVMGLVARWAWPSIIATVLFILAVNVVVTALVKRQERWNKQQDARVSDDTPAQRGKRARDLLRRGRQGPTGSLFGRDEPRGPAPVARGPSPRARPPRAVTAARDASGQVLTHRLHSEAFRLRNEDPELSAALTAVFAGLVEKRPVLVAELDTILAVAARLGVEDRVILYIRNLYGAGPASA